jgi:hypothetical protein
MTRPPSFEVVVEEAGPLVDVAVVRGPRAVERLFAMMQLDRSLKLIDDPSEL